MAALVSPAARVSELMAQGRKSAAALEALLQVQDDHAGIRELAAEILCCCDRALAALQGKPGRKKRKLGLHGAATQTTRPKRRTRTSSGETAATPTRVERKQNWDDGFVWTKYGQKGIRGSDHPRHYFRCAYTLDAGGCPARRQVQRSEEHDPPLYVLTYFADHTCCHRTEAISALDDVKILDFGSGGSRSPRPDDGDARSGKTSRSEELPVEVAKVESTPLSDLRRVGKVAELSSSADIHGSSSSSSAAWDPSASVSSDWDFFGDCSFDYVSEFFDVDDITLYR
ncbi:putative WRKY transcription factor 62 [Triticum urartu]|uniref:Putative WRKY transcription factor 62 n=1 Tax=Triticum urartu TaxID=4572 RepID=M7ZG87_TRIUA|nr:transcription factor WRKY45-2-like [Triticum urartu]EMS62233.1 putative WRKY transcription factor 62 [Triticum urartu]